MELQKTTETRRDFRVDDEQAVLTASVYEGTLSVGVAGVEIPATHFQVPASALPLVLEFLTAVDAELNPPIDPVEP